MKSIININTGKLLYSTLIDIELKDYEIAIDELLTDNFISPYFNFETRTFYEGATQEEINEAKKLLVPQEIQLWRVRTILKLMQLEQTIETALEQLDEPNKTAALSVWNYGTTIERYSQTVLLLQSILQMTDEQVDDIFIQADSIVI